MLKHNTVFWSHSPETITLHLNERVPSYSEMSSPLYKAILAIEGITAIRPRERYSFDIDKGMLFRWDTLMLQALLYKHYMGCPDNCTFTLPAGTPIWACNNTSHYELVNIFDAELEKETESSRKESQALKENRDLRYEVTQLRRRVTSLEMAERVRIAEEEEAKAQKEHDAFFLVKLFRYLREKRAIRARTQRLCEQGQ
jgi:hypothetical protein